MRAELDDPDWWEILALVRQLGLDPGSHVRASVEGWAHPWSAEAWILANLFDQWSARDARPYPRPSDGVLHPGNTPRIPQPAVREALAARGH